MLARTLALVLLVLAPAHAHALACVASNGTTVAAWCPRPPSFSHAALSISHDDGASWQAAAPEVQDACVTQEGVVFSLVSGSTPSLFRHGDAVTSQPLPLTTALAVRSLGAALYVVGQRGSAWLVVRTLDDGEHWTDLATFAPIGMVRDVDVTRGAHGPRIRIWSSEGLSCFGTVGEQLDVVEGGAVVSSVLLDETACANHGRGCARLDVLGLGAHGAVYGLARDSDDDVSGRIAIVAATEQITRTALHVATSASIAHNGRITLAVVDDRLVRIEGERIVLLDRHAPSGEALYVDPRGRAWVVSSAGLERFSRGRGFETIVRY